MLGAFVVSQPNVTLTDGFQVCTVAMAVLTHCEKNVMVQGPFIGHAKVLGKEFFWYECGGAGCKVPLPKESQDSGEYTYNTHVRDGCQGIEKMRRRFGTWEG